jgi:hypothetical protein
MEGKEGNAPAFSSHVVSPVALSDTQDRLYCLPIISSPVSPLRMQPEDFRRLTLLFYSHELCCINFF